MMRFPSAGVTIETDCVHRRARSTLASLFVHFSKSNGNTAPSGNARRFKLSLRYFVSPLVAGFSGHYRDAALVQASGNAPFWGTLIGKDHFP